MGTLVFQATLGGQVNLTGPNTASTFTISVPAVTGTMITSGDTATVTSTMLATSVYTAPGTIGSGTPNTGAFTTLSASSTVTLSGGTANGVAYLNGSKVLTTGTALTFDGTNFASTGNLTGATLKATRASGSQPEVVLTQTSVASWSIYNPPSSTDLRFYNGSDLLTLTSSGNLGLGVTPSAWYSTVRAMQLGSGGSIETRTNDATQISIGANYYLDASAVQRYISTNFASRMVQSDGRFLWFNAPSGTAGNAITFTQAMTLDASGNLLVGTTSLNTSGTGFFFSPNYNSVSGNGTLYIGNSGSTNAQAGINLYSTGAGAYRFYVDMGGTIHATSIVITAISDQRLKENVRDIDTGLSSIMALKPRRFDWKEGKGQDKKNAAGFIAQEFEEVFPECVSTSKAGADGIEYKNINHETLIPTLVKAIQEQQTLIESLTTRLTALEGKA